MDIESGLKKKLFGDTALHFQPFHHPALEVFGTKAPPYASLLKKDEGADELDDMSMFDVLPNAPLKTGDDFEDDSLNAPLKLEDDFKDHPPIASQKQEMTSKMILQLPF